MKIAYFNRFTLELPDQCVPDCSRRGACDEDVKYWTPKIDFGKISPDNIRDELSETGGWEARELQDDETNKQRIIWIAAGNIRDDEREENNSK